jgi:hypothetical protein
MNTSVFSKGIGDIVNQVTLPLADGETITNITVGTPTPTDANAPVLSILSSLVNPIDIQITGGTVGTAYGFVLTINTTQQILTWTVAVQVISDSFAPLQNEDPNSYQDLVGSIQAGESALAVTQFQFDPSFDPSGGYVLWDVIDSQGTVWASGNAYDYQVLMTGAVNIVIAKSIVNTPTSIPPTVDNPYQLRYTLREGNNVCYAYESLRVTGFPDMPIGAQDALEFSGDTAVMTCVTETLFANYQITVYQNGAQLASLNVNNVKRVANGYFVSASIDTTNLPVSLVPYQVVWQFWNAPGQTFRESCSLYVVNDSILSAIEDVKSKINKARTTLFGTEDSQYPSSEIVKWLRRGADAFNGAYGQFTSFTMTNAQGPIREFWLLYAEKYALESQYLLEGEKAFNFSGASVTLDVDKTQYLDNMIGKIQSTLDAEVKALKVNLIIRGNASGDGSVDVMQSSGAALGGVAISITPASIYNSGLYYGGVL